MSGVVERQAGAGRVCSVNSRCRVFLGKAKILKATWKLNGWSDCLAWEATFDWLDVIEMGHAVSFLVRYLGIEQSFPPSFSGSVVRNSFSSSSTYTLSGHVEKDPRGSSVQHCKHKVGTRFHDS